MATATKLRQNTRIQFCERHAPWFAGLSRYRKIECMVEGGPGGWTPGCKGGECRCWPGTDVFDPAYCGEADLDLDWTQQDEEQEEWERRASAEIGGVDA